MADEAVTGIHRNPNAADDGVLARRTLAGDKRAFDDLIVRYQRPATAVAYRLLGSTDDAMEVVQEAFLKAYKSLDTLQKPEAFAGWLMRIVSNLSLNFRRGRKTRQTYSLDAGRDDESSPHDPATHHPDSDPLHVLAGKQLGVRLETALAELPEKQRMAILLFTVEQMPQKQVAEALECSVEAVKWHVFQGRKKLKDLLKDVL
ncbi:MAG TPA: RNA polymerase sigma factor [Tepidisphaeraceae bacterium]